MKVVFITDSYYPKPSPNAICVSKLRHEFENRGIDTEIITIRTFARNVKRPDDKKLHFIEPDFFYSSWYEIYSRKNRILTRVMQLVFKLRGAIYGMFWPLMSLTHLSRYKRKLRDIMSLEIDKEVIVIGVYKSLEAALAGAEIKKEFAEAKYILYTLDSIASSNIPTIYGSKKIAWNSIKKWEDKLFEEYDFLYLMKSHRPTYTGDRYKKYLDKMRFVDIPLFCISTKEQSTHTSPTKRLVFTGSMASKTADPRYFLKVVESVGDDSIAIDFYGKIYDQDILDAISRSKYAKYRGLLSHEDVTYKQKKAFVLLNFGNYTACGIPCKIFEYFSTGKPIISCFKIDEDASKPYMEKYPNAILIDERKPIEENALSLKAFLASDFSYDMSSLSDLFYDNTPKATVDLILSDFNNVK